jgi:hypothetical protein
LLSSSYFLSPFFLSLLLTASLPLSSQTSSSLRLPHSSPSTSRGRRGEDDSEEGGREMVMKWMERNEGGEVVRRIERKEGERQ